jgi:hypothetical protein
MSARAVRWTCTRCGVSVGRIDGSPVAFPAGWTETEEGAHCLSCSRALAGEAAVGSAPAGSSTEDLLRIRRRGLIEFEIGRVPEASDQTIARACGTSASAVADVRQE